MVWKNVLFGTMIVSPGALSSVVNTIVMSRDFSAHVGDRQLDFVADRERLHDNEHERAEKITQHAPHRDKPDRDEAEDRANHGDDAVDRKSPAAENQQRRGRPESRSARARRTGVSARRGSRAHCANWRIRPFSPKKSSNAMAAMMAVWMKSGGGFWIEHGDVGLSVAESPVARRAAARNNVGRTVIERLLTGA